MRSSLCVLLMSGVALAGLNTGHVVCLNSDGTVRGYNACGSVMAWASGP
jgi:hypothetical protein